MEVIIRPTAQAASELVAALVATELHAKPDLVLGLATGRTMESVYSVLVRLHEDAGLDFSRCETFNLDEYIGLPASDPHSYRHYMDEHLFSRVNVVHELTHLPNGVAPDLGAESLRYEGLINAAGGIDLQLLGLGEAGHIAASTTLSALRSRTREKALTPTTRKQNAALFGPALSGPQAPSRWASARFSEPPLPAARHRRDEGRHPGEGRRRTNLVRDLGLRAAAPSRCTVIVVKRRQASKARNTTGGF